MTSPFRDRVYEQTTSTGTGTITLLGAPLGYQSFSVFGDGNQCYYVIAQNAANQWEVGKGTVHVTGGVTTLARTTVLASSNANALVNFNQTGRKDVRCPLPAQLMDWLVDPSTLIHADGSVAFSANQSFGGHKATNLADPTTGTDGANKEYVDAVAAAILAAAEAYADSLHTGDVTADNPTTVGDVPYWSTTARKLSSTSPLAVHTASSNKVETKVASFRAYNTAVDGATVIFDFDLADLWEVTLAGNRTLAYSHASKGQIVGVRLIQDGTGSRTVTWWANIRWHHSLAPVLDPTPAGSDLIFLECVGQDVYGVPIWEEVCRKSSAPRKGIYSNTDGATITFDLRKSPKHKVTLGGARTLALVESHVGQVFEVTLVQDGTGSRTVTWWAGISWAGGSAPTLSTAAGKADIFGFIETASGSYYGFVIGQGI
ncbi:MAG: hypothetical protein E6Q76_16905 [Rhizobium sp.]|nr:MAG: hypothetical protein E6Q76_16905 [Rhizobium sp.]